MFTAEKAVIFPPPHVNKLHVSMSKPVV